MPPARRPRPRITFDGARLSYGLLEDLERLERLTGRFVRPCEYAAPRKSKGAPPCGKTRPPKPRPPKSPWTPCAVDLTPRLALVRFTSRSWDTVDIEAGVRGVRLRHLDRAESRFLTAVAYPVTPELLGEWLRDELGSLIFFALIREDR